jgi:hypothetical protein
MIVGFLLPVLVVGWFVRKGIQNAEHPPKRDKERERLRRLKLQPVARLTLDELEDGVVLARRYGDPLTTAAFSKALAVKRKQRMPV